jgi:hypothetical protein
MNLLSREQSYQVIYNLLTARLPFFHVRFGDGELFTIENPMFQYKRSHPKTDALGMELREALSVVDEKYLIGVACEGWSGGKNKRMTEILEGRIRAERVLSATFLHRTFLEDFEAFKRFAYQVKKHAVLLIGGPSVCKSELVKRVFGADVTAELSDVDAYEKLDEIYGQISGMIEDYSNQYEVLVISALGPCSCVLGKRLWQDGFKDISFLDIGSVVDALAGLGTRSWIRNNAEYIKEKINEM